METLGSLSPNLSKNSLLYYDTSLWPCYAGAVSPKEVLSFSVAFLLLLLCSLLNDWIEMPFIYTVKELTFFVFSRQDSVSLI